MRAALILLLALLPLAALADAKDTLSAIKKNKDGYQRILIQKAGVVVEEVIGYQKKNGKWVVVKAKDGPLTEADNADSLKPKKDK